MIIDKNRIYRTRDGREVRIYATDGGSRYPVHGAVCMDDGWLPRQWTEQGELSNGRLVPSAHDLIEVRPRHKRTVWLNVHVNRSVIAHDLREEADKLFCKDVAPRIACIKVDLNFEEGEGL